MMRARRVTRVTLTSGQVELLLCIHIHIGISKLGHEGEYGALGGVMAYLRVKFYVSLSSIKLEIMHQFSVLFISMVTIACINIGDYHVH